MSNAGAVKLEQSEIPLNELRALTEAYYHIKSSYVKDVDDTTLIRAAIRGMVNSLDNHSRYLPPEEFTEFNQDNDGEYAGVGLRFKDSEFGLEIIEVIANSPAANAELKIGDIITHINGKSIRYVSVEEAASQFKGEVGSAIEMRVTGTGFSQPKDMQLKREIILLESVYSNLLPNQTGYIQLSQFTLHSVQEFIDAMKNLEKSAPLKKLIIDLRDNPGGVLEAAVELSDLFISQGKLLVSEGRTEDSNEVFYAHKAAPYANIKLLVILNQGSASASEIFAIALKDHQKATIFGEKSYGKGTIQTVFGLNEEAGMKITTAEYFSPHGTKIQDTGITPDIRFSKTRQKNTYNVSLLDDPQLLQAYNLLQN
ncbi:S41 family peptidase [Aliikangiella maris]|uniref:S41 family peptidase n=2 Tax=Aliikangiella maris TaxID=3162458 RepID=A0ABV3MP43_9GAMM